jgi:hypothetical protein
MNIFIEKYVCAMNVFVWVLRNWISNKLVALGQHNYVLELISNPDKTLKNANNFFY